VQAPAICSSTKQFDSNTPSSFREAVDPYQSSELSLSCKIIVVFYKVRTYAFDGRFLDDSVHPNTNTNMR